MVVYTNERMKKDLKKLKSKLKKRFQLNKFMLFGSRARGDYFLDSDVDVLIVSPDFKELKFVNRISKIIGYWNSPIDLEPLCYTPEEFKRKSKEIGIVRQAIKEGIEI